MRWRPCTCPSMRRKRPSVFVLVASSSILVPSGGILRPPKGPVKRSRPNVAPGSEIEQRRLLLGTRHRAPARGLVALLGFGLGRGLAWRRACQLPALLAGDATALAAVAQTD